MNTEQIIEQLKITAYAAKKGVTPFLTSSLSDSYIIEIINKVAQHSSVPISELMEKAQQSVSKSQQLQAQSPLLYSTIAKNAAESAAFQLIQKHGIAVDSSPKFRELIFFGLVRQIQAEHPDFWPLRSFVDKKQLVSPVFEFVGGPQDKPDPYKVDTAAALPSGKFLFNRKFMQALLDFAHIKGIKPKQPKYTNNGGNVPPEYAYIEFLIMHELMHYSHDDFYFQKIIPSANPDIINWVGDFRTNYLLVKSGYEQLPMGLFNDDINYDRQHSYTEMYDLVHGEMEKLQKDNGQQMSSALNQQGDDHGPGQQEGKQAPREVTDQVKPSDINANDKKTDESLDKDGKSLDRPKDSTQQTAPGSGKGGSHVIDPSSVVPRFNWRTLIDKFIKSAKPLQEETYSKPARRNVSNLSIARQVGAAAIKPGIKTMDILDVSLLFCVDASGSMAGDVAKVMSNALALLRQPMFAKAQVALTRFSGEHTTFKCIPRTDQASVVRSVTDKPAKYETKMSTEFSRAELGGTVFGPALAQDLRTALTHKYNVLIMSDGDVTSGSNFTNLVELIKSHPANVFVIFNNRESYMQFRAAANMSTPNITYMS
jgi:hypothetical protein